MRVEALAEDPSHAGAQTLLTRLDRPAARVVTQAAAPRAAEPTAVSTSVEPAPSATLANGTLANKTVVRTAVGGGRPASFDSEPTVIIQPKNVAGRKPAAAPAPPAAKRSSPRVPWSKGHPLRNAYEQLWKRDAGSGRKPETAWIRYRWPALGIALFLVAGVIFFAIRGTGSESSLDDHQAGRWHVVGPGITCGTRGSDCTVSRPNGDPIELTPEADAGFAFAAYTGDCAPGGRTLMTRPRTCGATFLKSESTAGSGTGADRTDDCTSADWGHHRRPRYHLRNQGIGLFGEISRGGRRSICTRPRIRFTPSWGSSEIAHRSVTRR